MNRISTNLPNDNMQFYLRERTRMMESLQNKIASQSRIENLRDDPVAAAHSVRYQSYAERLQRFSKNIQIVAERNRIAEGYIHQSTELLHRVRELAVQAANGIYAPEDLEYMSFEVNQIIEAMVEIANARSSDGTTLFSADKSEQLPFVVLRGIRTGNGEGSITDVRYIGGVAPNNAEIAENVFIQANIAGNHLFWAEPQHVFSRVDAQDYQVNQDGSFFIDGTEISVREGDTIHSIIHKINESGAPVRARLDSVYSSLVLEGTTPHQIWLHDGENSQTLQDLGIIDDSRNMPNNIAQSAVQTGGSVFDALIRLRDQMAAGDQEHIGTLGLQGIDNSLNSVLASLGRIGSINSRLDTTYDRTESERIEVSAQNSRNTDIDFAKAITDLKLLEYTHRAALGAAARVIQPTLLDFLN